MPMPYRLPQVDTSGCSPVSALAHWPAGRLFLLVTLLLILSPVIKIVLRKVKGDKAAKA